MNLTLLTQVAIGAALVFATPAAVMIHRTGRPFWQFSDETLPSELALTCAFLLAACIVALIRRKRPASFADVVISAAAALGIALFVMMFREWPPMHRFVLLATVALVCLLIVFVFAWPRLRLARLPTLAAALLAIVAGQAFAPALLPNKPSLKWTGSAFYDVNIWLYPNRIPKPYATGGAITRLNDDYLLATGDGTLYLLQVARPGAPLEVRELPLRIPINSSSFREHRFDEPVIKDRFRVADIHAAVDGKRVELFASHHYWHANERCASVRVSQLSTDVDMLLSNNFQGAWSTIYESTPCLAPKERPPGTNAEAFNGLQMGGRLAMRGKNELIVTLGDHEFDGVNSKVAYSQDPDASYGKIIAIDLSNKSHRILSIGNRNPQGLVIDASGAIWSTEHGPQGGDELNLIEEGLNYGWPLVTYGTNYGTHDWPGAPANDHRGYAEPAFAWVPAIGISSLITVEGQLFEHWRGDLIVSSLRAQSIFRVKLVDNRVTVVEPIHIGVRIRDLVEGPRGEIVIWDEQTSTIAILEPFGDDATGDAVAAGRLFAQCAGCHAIGTGKSHGIGPDLHGVVGRKVAPANGFNYSDALRAVGGRWTETALDAFLRDPAAFAPGTSMSTKGIDDRDTRQRIIEYLASGER